LTSRQKRDKSNKEARSEASIENWTYPLFSKSKMMKELRSEVEKARADEAAKQAEWDLEKSKEVDLERQLGLERN